MPTKIEWATEVWNPITGCSKISEGCKNCYAERMAKRLAGRYGYPKEKPFAPGVEHTEKWIEPSRWTKPRRIFVCSMGDLFHEDVLRGYHSDIIDVMLDAPQHTYLLLTKRPHQMARFAEDVKGGIRPNWWLGVTCENQEQADKRIPILLQIPAAVRFVSVEPMLEEIDLYRGGWSFLSPLHPPPGNKIGWKRGIDWVICGGESGPGARPMHPGWVRSLKDQCQAAGTPFFFKQWGDWKPIGQMKDGEADLLSVIIDPDEDNPFGKTRCSVKTYTFGLDDDIWINGQPHTMFRVGKKAAGRLLDGRTWEQYPNADI